LNTCWYDIDYNERDVSMLENYMRVCIVILL
jgi:hypothetical protein